MAMVLAAAMAAPAPLLDHSALSDIGENMAYDVLQEGSDGIYRNERDFKPPVRVPRSEEVCFGKGLDSEIFWCWDND
ncbi:hypothetical protein BDV24DRAFT_168512 [Aspergillus arachidicola]|uniref:Uncharacterized protein n=1 Tax=Aspergillus arachidicola TaxID=656916 RepID=A0A5N6XX39_9EURO|nr:hypothetical protein BDV24DRAFT_168512 [Aspergillus arachidicola]